jgi:hypothetical protein
MLRPLPPFRVRPLKKPAIRKSHSSDSSFETIEGVQVSIRALRRPLKAVRPTPESRLKVLGRGATSHA